MLEEATKNPTTQNLVKNEIDLQIQHATNKTVQIDKPKLKKFIYDSEINSLKVLCQLCQSYFYTFQQHNHSSSPKHELEIQPNKTQKKEQQKLNEKKEQPKLNKQQPKSRQQAKVQIIQNNPQEEQNLNANKQLGQDLVKQNQKVTQLDNQVKEREDFAERQKQIAQLNRFQQAKLHVSRLMEVQKSRIQNKLPQLKPQEVQPVHCPFCYKKLKLDELDHVDTCKRAIKCDICNEKISQLLKSSHSYVCSRKRTTKQQQHIPLLNKYIAMLKNNEQQVKQQNKKPRLLKNPRKQKQGLVKSRTAKTLHPYGKQIKQQNKELQNRPQVEKQLIKQQKPAIRSNQNQKYTLKIQSSNNRKIEAEVPPPVRVNEQKLEIDPFALNMQSMIRARQKRGLSKYVLANLKTTVYNQQQFENQKSCSICWGQYEEGEQVMRLSCSHIFHRECLLPHFQTHTGCPFCKTKVSG